MWRFSTTVVNDVVDAQILHKTRDCIRIRTSQQTEITVYFAKTCIDVSEVAMHRSWYSCTIDRQLLSLKFCSRQNMRKLPSKQRLKQAHQAKRWPQPIAQPIANSTECWPGKDEGPRWMSPPNPRPSQHLVNLRTGHCTLDNSVISTRTDENPHCEYRTKRVVSLSCAATFSTYRLKNGV